MINYTLLPFKQSPNYTPAGQTAAFYGRPRTIEFGAGHWWDDPTRFPSFSGVVATLMNAARQASAQDVVGDQQVQPLVRREDTSWATGGANPFTYSMEVDPQIIYRWWAGGDKAKANRIFETLCTRIADLGLHNLPWKPHKYWMNTGCNPIPWDEVMQHAKEVWQEKYGQPAQPPQWLQNLKKWDSVQKKTIIRTGAPLRDLAHVEKQIKTFNKGDVIEIAAETRVGNYVYWLSKYALENGTGQGFDEYEFEKPDVRPEWQKNLKDITPVNLMVLVPQTPVINLNDGSVIKQLGQGTNVDFTKMTTVGGVEYLISSYSATNAMPNGIKRADVGVPAQPPVNEKPEWLAKWLDITDVVMYARADTDLVNFENGSTIKVIPRGEKLEIASTTEWHGQKFAITKYSTDKKFWQGVRIDDLDMKPIVNPDVPVEPAPEQPDLTPSTSVLMAFIEMLGKLISEFLAKFKK